MCSPTAVIVGAGAMAGMGAVGAGMSQAAQNASLKAQAKINESNALLADEEAKQVLREGRQAKSAAFREAGDVQAMQRSAAAAGNLDVLAGSMLALYQETDPLVDADMYEIDYRAWLGERAAKARAAQLRAEARMLRRSRQSPLLAAGTSLFGGGVAVAGLYSGFKSAKMI